jgi:hypothetical protein
MVLLVLSCPVDEEPNVSCRRFALRIDVSSFTIWRTLHEQGLHPYHLQRVQHLKSEDPPRRIAFYQWLLQWVVISDVGNRIDGASPCKALIPICNIISKGKLCSNNSKSGLYLPNIYVAVARVAEVSYLLVLY